MRNCPKCGEETISNKELFFSSIGIPGVVAHCRKCYAMVSAQDTKRGFFGEIFYLFFDLYFVYFVILSLAIWSLVNFSTIWVGIIIFSAWRLLRTYLSIIGPLDYDKNL